MMLDNIPLAGASISTVALSVSISISGSPLVTESPAALSHWISVPVSCAIPRAGMITSFATLNFPLLGLRFALSIRALSRFDMSIGPTCAAIINAGVINVFVRLRFARSGQGTRGCVIFFASDHELFSGEARDNFTAIFGNDELLFNTRGRPAISGWPVGFERENHSFFNFFGTIE